MTLTFLGTRGNIDVGTRRHRRHTSTLVTHGGARVMLDCGADWLPYVGRVAPDAIVLTHAHPDHAAGLRHGAPCPVYAPAAVWRAIQRWPIAERRLVRVGRAVEIRGIRFQAWPVEHSRRAPAVGYRIAAGSGEVFYVPDVLRIRRLAAALRGVGMYIGDGAAIVRPIVRGRGRARVGHAPIAAQLDWCAQTGVRRAIFTHCGRAIVAAAPGIEAAIAALGRERGVDTRVAYDGLRVVVRRTAARRERADRGKRGGDPASQRTDRAL